MKKTLFLILTVVLLAFVCHADSSDYTYTVLDEAEKTCRITKYSGADEFLSIPGTLDGYTVTQIGDRAFLGNDAIVTLTIPETLKYIGIDAFWHCSSLKTVTLPASFPGSGLAAGAFGYCEALEKIDLPEGMKNLGQLMFIGCKALQEIEIPDTVRTIGANAFTDCAGLKTLTLPSALTSIGEWAFRGCTELTSITFNGGGNPDESLLVAYWMFSECMNLETLTFNEGYYNVSAKAFEGRKNLHTVTFKGGQSTIAKDAFWDCTALEKAVLPSGGVQVLENTGLGTALKNLTLFGSMDSFDLRLLAGYSNLKTLTLPDSLTAIVHSDERDMPEHMRTMTMPRNLTSVDSPWLQEQPYRSGLNLHVYYGSFGHAFAEENNFYYRLFNQSLSKIDVKNPLNLYPGQSGRFTLITEPEDLNPDRFISPQLIYSSNKPEIATVDEYGYVTGNAVGKTTIIIQDKDDPFVYARAQVNVIPEDTIRPAGNIKLRLDTSLYNKAKLIVDYGVTGLYPPYDIALEISGHTNELIEYTDTTKTSYRIELPLETTKDTYTFTYRFNLLVTDANGITDDADGYFSSTRKYTYDPGGYRYNPTTGKVSYYGPSEDIDWDDTVISGDDGVVNLIAHIEPLVDKQILYVGEVTEPHYHATTQDGYSSRNVYYVSSNPSVIKVDPSGGLIGLAPGKSVITVRAADGSGEYCTIDFYCGEYFVNEIKLEAGDVDRETLQQKLTATILPAEAANAPLEWYSSDEDVATVDENGIATWHTAGSVVFSVFAMDGTDAFAICEYQWDGIKVEKLELFLRPNGQQVGWRVEPANATNPMVTFRVDKPAFVEIDAAGYLRFYDDCDVTVRALTTDGSEISADLVVSGKADHPHLPYPGRISGKVTPASGTTPGSIPALKCVICKETGYAARSIDPARVAYLPEGLKQLKTGAFGKNTGFEQVNLPDGLTVISSGAFENCSSPLVVIVPDSVTNIAKDAFRGVSCVIFVCSQQSYAYDYAIGHDIAVSVR